LDQLLLVLHLIDALHGGGQRLKPVLRLLHADSSRNARQKLGPADAVLFLAGGSSSSSEAIAASA